jgi:4-amino-4-deoxy-L-arabinose transferase-like glycosyltransferase
MVVPASTFEASTYSPAEHSLNGRWPRRTAATTVADVNNTRRTALGLGVLAALLRLPHAFGDSLWQDEVASARIIREPTFTGMLRHVVRTESTPPLWYALAWLAHHAGLSIHDDRLLSVVCDGALVAAVVLLAERLLPLRFAAAAGALVAVGAQFSAHGHELRAYELFALLAVLLAFTLHGAMLRPSRRRLAALATVTAAGLLTHYFFAFTLAAAVAWLWLEPAARRTRRQVTVALAAGAAAAAPWSPWLLKQMRADRYSWIGRFRVWEVVSTPLQLFTGVVNGRVIDLVVLAWVVAGAVVAWRRGPLARLCAVLALVPLGLAAVTWAGGENVYDVRNMLAIGPFVAVSLVLALAALPRRLSAAAAATACAAAAAAFAWVQVASPPTPFQGLARALVAAGWRPHDPVVVFGPWFDFRSPLEWYLPHSPALAPVPKDALGRHVVFLIARHPHVRSRDPERVGAFLVERLGPRLPAQLLRHATVLGPPVRRSRV